MEKWMELKTFADTIIPTSSLTGALGYTLAMHGRTVMLTAAERERAACLHNELMDLFSIFPADIVSAACLSALIRVRMEEPDARQNINDFVLRYSHVESRVQ